MQHPMASTKATKTAVRKAIQACGGNLSDVARHFDVNRVTVYRWLTRWELRPVVAKARASMHEVSDDVIYARLFSEDDDAAFEAARFVKLHMNDDGSLRLSPDTLVWLARMGLKPATALEQFEAMIQQQAAMESSGGGS